MRSLILSTATRFLLPLILLFSIFMFFRGHNSPGGGFIGGLVAAAAIALYMLAYDIESARRLLVVPPNAIIAVGLLLAAAAGSIAWISGYPFLSGRWTTLNLAGNSIPLGTPLLFDVGVYLVVFGATAIMLFTLEED